MKAYCIDHFGSVDGVLLQSRADPQPGRREILVPAPRGRNGAGWGEHSLRRPLGLARPDRDRQARRSYAAAVNKMSDAGPGLISRLEARRSARPHHRYKVTPKSCPTCAGKL
jgi:hypothetical protein